MKDSIFIKSALRLEKSNADSVVAEQELGVASTSRINICTNKLVLLDPQKQDSIAWQG